MARTSGGHLVQLSSQAGPPRAVSCFYILGIFTLLLELSAIFMEYGIYLSVLALAWNQRDFGALLSYEFPKSTPRLHGLIPELKETLSGLC